jgi:hypothetical protein
LIVYIHEIPPPGGSVAKGTLEKRPPLDLAGRILPAIRTNLKSRGEIPYASLRVIFVNAVKIADGAGPMRSTRVTTA